MELHMLFRFSLLHDCKSLCECLGKIVAIFLCSQNNKHFSQITFKTTCWSSHTATPSTPLWSTMQLNTTTCSSELPCNWSRSKRHLLPAGNRGLTTLWRAARNLQIWDRHKNIHMRIGTLRLQSLVYLQWLHIACPESWERRWWRRTTRGVQVQLSFNLLSNTASLELSTR